MRKNGARIGQIIGLKVYSDFIKEAEEKEERVERCPRLFHL